MSQPIYGRIINYRIGIRTQMSNECLIQLPRLVSAAQTGQLVGRRVVWRGGKTTHNGRVMGFHGKNGIVRVKFKKGVPGQALGTEVELL